MLQRQSFVGAVDVLEWCVVRDAQGLVVISYYHGAGMQQRFLAWKEIVRYNCCHAKEGVFKRGTWVSGKALKSESRLCKHCARAWSESSREGEKTVFHEDNEINWNSEC